MSEEDIHTDNTAGQSSNEDVIGKKLVQFKKRIDKPKEPETLKGIIVNPIVNKKAGEYLSKINRFKINAEINLKYQKHPDWINNPLLLPAGIYQAYFPNGKPIFTHIAIPEQIEKLLPINNSLLTRIKIHNVPDTLRLFSNYQIGFYEGVSHDFKPYLDNQESRINKVMSEIKTGLPDIPIKVYLPDYIPKEYYTPEIFKDFGIKVGKAYKAWNLVFENPNTYIAVFEEWNQGSNLSQIDPIKIESPSVEGEKSNRILPGKRQVADATLPSFKDYLTETGVSIFPVLQKNYKDKKPKEIVLMLMALNHYGLLSPNPLKNKSKFHKALQNDLGEIGTREAYQPWFNKFPEETVFEEAELKVHQDKIQSYIRKK